MSDLPRGGVRQELARLHKEKRQAEERLEEAVKEAFPSGTVVAFTWGDHERVVRIVRNFGDSVRVVGVSGREYGIPAYHLYREQLS